VAKLEINIQLAAGELIAISQLGRDLDMVVYREVFDKYGIREEQIGVVSGIVGLEIFRRIPGFDDNLYEGPKPRL